MSDGTGDAEFMESLLVHNIAEGTFEDFKKEFSPVFKKGRREGTLCWKVLLRMRRVLLTGSVCRCHVSPVGYRTFWAYPGVQVPVVCTCGKVL